MWCHQAVLLTSGLQTVARCVSAIPTAVVTPSPVSAPVTPTAGVPCANMPASVPGTATATPSMETAPATRAGGRPPAPSHASAPAEDLWVPAVTSSLAGVSVTGATGGSNALSLATATCQRVTSVLECVTARPAGGDRAVTDDVTATSQTAGVIRLVGNVCATQGTRVSSATRSVRLGSMAVVVK